MSEQKAKYSTDDRTPLDKKGNIIGVGDILVARRSGEELRFKVLAVDTLQGSGSVQIECLGPVEPGFERRWISRHDLWQGYEIETKATHEYPASFNIDEYEQQRTRDRDYNERERQEAIRDEQGGVTEVS